MNKEFKILAVEIDGEIYELKKKEAAIYETINESNINVISSKQLDGLDKGKCIARIGDYPIYEKIVNRLNHLKKQGIDSRESQIKILRLFFTTHKNISIKAYRRYYERYFERQNKIKDEKQENNKEIYDNLHRDSRQRQLIKELGRNKYYHSLFIRGLKHCSKCSEVKPLSEFNKDIYSSTGYSVKCKDCNNKKNRNYIQKLKNIDKRFCEGCFEEKPSTDFYDYAHNGNYKINSWWRFCKKCYNKHQREYYKNHKKTNIIIPMIKETSGVISPNILLEPKTKIIVENQQPKPDIKISNGTNPDAIPVVLSNTFDKKIIDEKPKTPKTIANWKDFLFNIKKRTKE